MHGHVFCGFWSFRLNKLGCRRLKYIRIIYYKCTFKVSSTYIIIRIITKAITYTLVINLQMQTNRHLKPSKKSEDAKCGAVHLISIFKGDNEKVEPELPFTLPEKCRCDAMSACKWYLIFINSLVSCQQGIHSVDFSLPLSVKKAHVEYWVNLLYSNSLYRGYDAVVLPFDLSSSHIDDNAFFRGVRFFR